MQFPWWVANRITLATRDQLLWATERLVRVLTGKVDKGDPVLSRQLLRELALTALKAPGFTDDQKVRIVQAAGPVGGEFTLSSFAVSWPFLALGRKSEVEEDVLELYASILREATAKSIEVASPKTAVSEFGNIGIAWPADRDSMTLAEVAEVEWKTVNTLLCEALGRDTTGTVV
ncbi:MAG: hypothetical protein M1837_006644 [Sclerophora amabilis]|nr:MAG: hypothetical protein M1837_006644 [Sclerophora amabilis]